MSELVPQAAYRLSPSELAPEAIPLTNDAFIRAAFEGIRWPEKEKAPRSGSARPFPADGPALPMGVHFAGDPKKGCWAASPLIPGSSRTPVPELPDHNCYYSVSVFRPVRPGCYQRRNAQFAGQYVVVLDDVVPEAEPEGARQLQEASDVVVHPVAEGSSLPASAAPARGKARIPFGRVTLPPSYALETSENNYQVGYFLKSPITDLARAEALADAIADAGLSDPGAKGPGARLMRLPVGSNGKTRPAFRNRLRLWAPNRRYSASELASGLILALAADSRPATAKTHAGARGNALRAAAPRGGSAVFIPAPAENPVLKALRSRGLVKQARSAGLWEITCPWVKEHTDATDSGTAYWEPDAMHPAGGFRCLHGHCADRNVADLLKFLDLSEDDACMKPRIRVLPGEVSRIAVAAEGVLAATGHFFRQGGRIVRIVKSPDGTRIEEPTAQALMFSLDAAARWQRYDGRSKKEVVCDPPEKHMKVILDRGEHEALPELLAVARQPAIGPGGRIFKTPGYWPEAKLYGDFRAEDYASIPESLGKADAEAALRSLSELLSEFEFEAPCDRTAALSAILTAAVRGTLPLAPMFHVTAHLPASGKSYLTSLVSVFATPGDVASSCFPKDDEECRKFLLAQLLSAPPVIVFDNLTRDIVPFKSLCTAITEPILNGRVLRATKTVNVSTRTLLLSSGNNAGPVEDMARRVVTVRLAPKTDRPGERVFRRPRLLDRVRRERALHVGAALTVIAAWLQAGSPKSPCRTLGSFLEWSDLCRQPLLWLGEQDPASRLFEVQEENSESELTAAVFHELGVLFHSAPFAVRDIAWRGDDPKDRLFDALAAHGLVSPAGLLDRRSTGWWLKRKVGWVAGGMKLARAGTKYKMPTYRIEFLAPPAAPPEAPPEKAREKDPSLPTGTTEKHAQAHDEQEN